MRIEGVQTIYDARPQSIGSWKFEIREGDEHGDLVAEFEIKGMKDEGTIKVGRIPFELTSAKGLAHRLLFEDQPLARAEPKGAFALGNTVVVEGALLAPGVEVGDRVVFELETKGGLSSDVTFSLDGTLWGEITKEAVFSRHFMLRFNDAVPLVLQVFCFAVLMARARRQARSS